jgi:hypothetical protein
VTKLLDAMMLNSIGQQIQQIAYEMLEEIYEEAEASRSTGARAHARSRVRGGV